MTTTDPTAGLQIVSGDYDEAAAHHDALLREIESLREQLAEAREQWRHVADALARAETERDEARAEIARLERAAHEQGADLWIAEDRLDRLRRQVLAVAEDLERYASDPRPARLPMSERKLAWTLRQIVAGERPEAPETAPTAPQTGEQTGVRVETGTETASARVDLVIGLRQRGVPQHPDGPEAAALAEIDRLRTEAAMLRAEREWLADRARTMGIAEAIIAAHGPAHAVSAEVGRLRAKVKHLSARVREWEAVNADLAARCDSGDIPIRFGERYSQAVLREINRLRTERDRLMDELPEDNTIVAAIRRLRTALNTQEGSR